MRIPIPMRDLIDMSPWGNSAQIFSDAVDKAVQHAGSVAILSQKTKVSEATIRRIMNKKFKSIQRETYKKLFHYVARFLPDQHVLKNPGRDRFMKIRKREN